VGSQELAAEAAARSEAVLKLSREYTAILHEMNGQIESTGTAPLFHRSNGSSHAASQQHASTLDRVNERVVGTCACVVMNAVGQLAIDAHTKLQQLGTVDEDLRSFAHAFHAALTAAQVGHSHAHATAHICAGTGLAATTTGTGLTPATSAPGLSSRPPHLRWD
jgi:hypothetical protein